MKDLLASLMATEGDGNKRAKRSGKDCFIETQGWNTYRLCQSCITDFFWHRHIGLILTCSLTRSQTSAWEALESLIPGVKLVDFGVVYSKLCYLIFTSIFFKDLKKLYLFHSVCSIFRYHYRERLYLLFSYY